MDRRAFLSAASGFALAACGERATATAARTHAPLRPLGVQLYTVRDRMRHDVAATLRAVAEIGYREVETAGLFDLSPERFRAALDAAGLVSPAGHVGIDAVRSQPDAVLALARTLGQSWVVVPWLDAAERTPDGYRRLARDLNTFGAHAADAGIRAAYHNHDFEFARLDGGAAGYDLLLAATDPALVDFQLDLFWAVKGGRDPVELIRTHPGRFPHCHVKDMADVAGAQRMVTVGAGEIDFAAIFAHAEAAGLRHYFVEHDEPDDSLASIRAAFSHLRQLSF